jgi:hypothetical protein
VDGRGVAHAASPRPVRTDGALRLRSGLRLGAAGPGVQGRRGAPAASASPGPGSRPRAASLSHRSLARTVGFVTGHTVGIRIRTHLERPGVDARVGPWAGARAGWEAATGSWPTDGRAPAGRRERRTRLNAGREGNYARRHAKETPYPSVTGHSGDRLVLRPLLVPGLQNSTLKSSDQAMHPIQLLWMTTATAGGTVPHCTRTACRPVWRWTRARGTCGPITRYQPVPRCVAERIAAAHSGVCLSRASARCVSGGGGCVGQVSIRSGGA